jgi:hypothetical protein
MTLALAVPAGAQAAHPITGAYSNASQKHGAYLETSRHTIRTLHFFCRKAKYDHSATKYQYRASRFEVRDLVHVSPSGAFSYRGTADRFGPEGQPLGRWKLHFTGRFTTSRTVRIKRTISGCSTATVVAHAAR